MTHLTERSHALLLRGSLPRDEARPLARHLGEPCAVCEEFLASRLAADAADGLVEAVLEALGAAEGRGNDLEFARIERRLREAAPAVRAAPRHALAGAVAAAVLAAGLAGLVAPRPSPHRAAWDGEKGASLHEVPVQLRYAVVRPVAGGAPTVEKGVSGEPLPAGASLLFEIETGRPARAALVRVGTDGAPEAFWSDGVGPGRSTVTVGGRPASYPLRGLTGPQRFVLVASDDRLDADRAVRAAEALARPDGVAGDLEWLPGLSLDMVEVEVR